MRIISLTAREDLLNRYPEKSLRKRDKLRSHYKQKKRCHRRISILKKLIFEKPASKVQNALELSP